MGLVSTSSSEAINVVQCTGGDPCHCARGDPSTWMVSEVPMMTTFHDHSLGEDHRDKSAEHFPSLVAKGIPTREANRIPTARASVDTEWKKL